MFLIFNIIKRKLGGGETAAVGKSSKYGFIGGIIVLLIIIGFYIYYYNSTELLRRYAEAKFTEPTSVYDSGTAAFRLDLIRLMYSIALWISLFFRFGLFDSYCQRRAADYKFFVLIVRCMCITVILFLGIVIKTLVLPNGTLLITHSGALFVSRSSKPVISEDRIYRNCNEMDLVRLTGYQKHELVYRNFHIMLKYDGKTLLKFNKMAERGKLHKIEVKSADHMYRYEFDALIYSKDDVPFVIKFKDINKYNMRDEALIEACEKLISEGYFEAFEFACEYLLAYDEDFIKPVIEIYSQKEPDYFDEDFISRRNSYIKPEYMKEFARSIR